MAETREELLAALAWQVELGATEAIGDAPVNRFKAPEPAPAPREVTKAAQAAPAPEASPEAPPAASPAGAKSLDALRHALEASESDLKAGARNCVFADGLPGARLMVIGEAPGAEEDRQGKPFVGRSGQLLDRMLAAIGLSRTAETVADAVYITNILPWRPSGNRTPSDAEAAQFLPFVLRHIELAGPEVLLCMGGVSAKHLLGSTQGIKRLRGRWHRHEATGLPLMASFHPAYLLRQPADKRLAWRDLLAVRAVLDGAQPG